MARALADARRAPHGARAEALERRPLVGEGGEDAQVIADELVVVLGVGHRRLEQLAPVAGRRARREGEDGARLVDRLAADVVADEPRLAGRRAHVARLRADDGRGRADRLGRAAPLRLGLRRLLGLGLLGLARAAGTAARAALARGLGGRVGDRLGGLLVDLGLGRGGPLGLRFSLLARARLGTTGFARRARRGLLGRLLGAGLDLGGRRLDLGLLGADVGGRLVLLGAHVARRVLAALAVGHQRTFPEPAWPRYVRVGANSPSLWPTIDSLTKTGTCLRPSWTAIVCPTISGKIVEVRDQVLTMVLALSALRASTRRIRRSSTHGPFLLDRLIAPYPSRDGDRGRYSGRTACSSCACD